MNEKSPGKTNCLSGAGSSSATSACIPAVPPALKNDSQKSFFHSLCLTRTNVLTYFTAPSHFYFYPQDNRLFDQSAPECSRYLLSQTALSVGDAVFLSMSDDQSLHLCIFCRTSLMYVPFVICFITQFQ